MSKYRKGMLYVRRLKASDKANSYITALQIAAKKLIAEEHGRGLPFVLVQHGFRGQSVMEVGDSRAELQARIWGSGGLSFKATARAWRIRAP